MSNKALSLHIQNQQFFPAHNTQKKKSKEKNFHRGFCAHKKREKGPRGFGSLGRVVSLSLVVFCVVLSRENKHQIITREKREDHG
jgi:cytoskeletal protein RodZ